MFFYRYQYVITKSQIFTHIYTLVAYYIFTNNLIAINIVICIWISEANMQYESFRHWNS